MDGKNRRHANAFTVRVSIRPIASRRTSGRCHRERSTTNADSSFSTKTEAPSADDLGSDILGRSPQPVLRLATSPDLRPGRHCRPLASRTVPEVLGQVVQAAAPASRSPRYRRRTPPVNRASGRCQSLWRAPRIHGELKMLGIAISERTVSRILRRLRRPPNQTWRTFLHNHVGKWSPSISLPCPQSP
jgi:hypothetical protein